MLYERFLDWCSVCGAFKQADVWWCIANLVNIFGLTQLLFNKHLVSAHASSRANSARSVKRRRFDRDYVDSWADANAYRSTNMKSHHLFSADLTMLTMPIKTMQVNVWTVSCCSILLVRHGQSKYIGGARIYGRASYGVSIIRFGFYIRHKRLYGVHGV